MSSAVRKTKKRPAFKPQLGLLAPAIAWLPVSECEAIVARMKEILTANKDRVVAGLNAASRCVENNEAVALVMARPPVLRLVQHIPLLAAAKRVPLLCLSVPCLSAALPHLRSCLVFAIKKPAGAAPDGTRAPETNEVNELVKLVRECGGTSSVASESCFAESTRLAPPVPAVLLHRTRVERKAPRRKQVPLT